MFNVNRVYPAPLSLKKKSKYDLPDVHEALQQCFYGKCYICEAKDPLDINIEHFIPQDIDKEKTFDWDNLYLACSRCNNIKRADYNGLLDCCNESVWERIKLLPGFSARPKELTVKPLSDDAKTMLTAKLLSNIYNSDNTMSKRLTAASLRSQVTKTSQLLLKNINKYYEPDSTKQEKDLSIEKMKLLISRESAFSAFCRWIIMDDMELSEILKPFMD